MKKRNLLFALLAFCLLSSNSTEICKESIKASQKIKLANSQTEYLYVYNSEDYILEDEENEETGEIDKGLVSLFEDYMLEEENRNVKVIYNTFDTNESMLSELKTGKQQYDLVCPSDYVIQKMIAENMVVPFDDDSTPNYNTYVSPFVLDKLTNIPVTINGESKTDIVNHYARGYMWGTLGILYNDGYKTLASKGITAKEMDEDMKSWSSLWDKKYFNLTAIKNSMRDTYAAGILYTYNDDFELDGVNYDGLETLKAKYENGSLTEEEYNDKLTTIFNLCDDTTIDRVQDSLSSLIDNAFGFEVDSGKSDMAQGNKFAINVAWSGDAAWAMDMADENNDAYYDEETEEYEEGFDPTILKYSLPESGANIWFDGWVMPTGANKELASKFVDFLSDPENAASNMEYIGYTPVIGGDAVLDLVKSWYDLRYDEETEELDEAVLDDYEEVDVNDIDSLEDSDGYYYTKDISYFFSGTLEEYDDSDAIFALAAEMKDRQFDTQYPDKSILPRLAVMADFSTQTDLVSKMWSRVKTSYLPLGAYIVSGVIILCALGFIIYTIAIKIYRKRVREN